MNMIDHGITGVKRQSFRRGEARNIVAKILRANPRISDDDLLEKIRPIALRNEEFLDIALVYYAAGERRNLTRGPRLTEPKRFTPPVIIPEKKLEEVRAAMKKRVEHMVLLDMIMPNDKPLRDQTAKDCAKLVKHYAKESALVSKLGPMLKPGQKVGDAFSEAQVQKIYRAGTK